MYIADFEGLGITFKRLTEEHIEMMRLWRNSDDVRPFMQYQEIITADQQKSWFKNLDKKSNYYFIAYRNQEAFGVFNIKDVDFKEGIGEAGIFLKNRSFWEGDLTMRGSILLFKFAFEKLQLKGLISHVLKNNTKTLTYNKQMGFQIDEKIEKAISYQLKLTRERFYENKKIKKIMMYLNSN